MLFSKIVILGVRKCHVVEVDAQAAERVLAPQGTHVERGIAVAPEGSTLTSEVMDQIAMYGVILEGIAVGH